MLHNSFALHNSNPNKLVAYRQDLLRKVVLPLIASYPEIVWFADEKVAATEEGTTNSEMEESYTHFLMEKGFIPKTHKKYIELERMLHSVVCFHLLLDGSSLAYEYWTQGQKEEKLSFENFKQLHTLALQYVDKQVIKKVMEASLVYSDLGKTPEAKKRALQFDIHQSDHDDFMDAIYTASHDIRDQIIPSFKSLNEEEKNSIIALHRAVPLHWGHAYHLEGGEKMFARLLQQKNINDTLLNQAFLIQVCDVAASAFHANLKGAVAFNEATYLGYIAVKSTVKELLNSHNSYLALLDLTIKRAKLLGYPLNNKETQYHLLARLGAFMRLYTKEEGALLKKCAEQQWSINDWKIIDKMFGMHSGINNWNRNPTYMPAVLINLLNAEPAASDEKKCFLALQGVLVMAKICKILEERGQAKLNNPISFNQVAGLARTNPEFFYLKFNSNQISITTNHEVVIKSELKKQSPYRKS
ncbi:MAG: hypothetical protein JWM09_1242 [Francisellaceae bacterium]|nr:hypothetical protein [Francisellaceae bacterium]